ncbi:MAG: hypothetical protein KDK71_09665, partial [Chlamydiia bacterium]|nr:hypothetical protein [Chlamydiia bacterium]
MLLSYFYPSHLRFKKPGDYTWIETLVSYPATISEIDVAIIALVPSLIAASYYQDTFIGGPSTKFGIFQAIAIHTVTSMALQQYNEKQLPSRKLDIDRPLFVSLENVLDSQSKLGENLLNISTTDAKIKANEKKQEDNEKIKKQQSDLKTITTWITNHEDDPDRLKNIQNYVQFAMDQASLIEDAHKKEVLIQTLQAEIDQLKLDCTLDNIEIIKCEIRKAKLKKEEEEIKREDQGKLTLAKKRVREAQEVYDGILKEYNAKQARVTKNKSDLQRITDEIIEKSQRNYNFLEEDSQQHLISEAKENIKCYEDLHNQINLRLSNLKNETLCTNNQKESFEEEINKLNNKLVSLKTSSKEQKEERKKSYLDWLEKECRRLEGEMKSKQEQIDSNTKERSKLNDIPAIKQLILELNKELLENNEKIKQLAPDQPGKHYGTIDGVKFLNKKKSEESIKCQEAKETLYTLQQIQRAINQELENRENKKKDPANRIARLNSEQSENTKLLEKLDLPDGNETISEEIISQSSEASIENTLSSASTQLIQSVMDKIN